MHPHRKTCFSVVSALEFLLPKKNEFADGQQLRTFFSNVKIVEMAVEFNYHNIMAKVKKSKREKENLYKGKNALADAHQMVSKRTRRKEKDEIQQGLVYRPKRELEFDVDGRQGVGGEKVAGTKSDALFLRTRKCLSPS